MEWQITIKISVFMAHISYAFVTLASLLLS